MNPNATKMPLHFNGSLPNVPWNETTVYSSVDFFHKPDVAIIALYVVVLTASLSANTLLIFIVIKFQYMRSVTNIFLVNLSVADLLVTLFCMPVQIAKSVTLLWYFGEVMCKTVNFLQGVAVASSVFTITAMSVDRYLAITQSLRQPWMPSRQGACCLLAGLWFLSLLIFVPLLFVAVVEREIVPVLARTRNGSVSNPVFTITAMSVDRYLAITQSLRQPWMPSRQGDDRNHSPASKQQLLAVAGLWFLSLLIFVPLLFVAVVEREIVPVLARMRNGSVVWIPRSVEFCTETWPEPIKKELYGAFSFVLVYAIPGCLVVVCYSLMGRRLCSVLPPFDQTEGSANSQQRLRLVRERKRVAWILLLLAVLFALCWLPYNILQLLVDVNAVKADSVFSVLPYTLLLGHANSAINPIVYCLMTRNFRRSLRKLLCQDPGNIHSSTHFHMQGLRQKSNTSSLRTCTTVTFRSSNHLNRAQNASVQYGRARGTSLRDTSWKERQKPQYL